MNINVNDIKNGMTIIIDGKLCLIEDFQHVKPGKGSAFMRMKLRNLKTGAVVENTYNTNIKIEKARVDRLPMQFLYADGSNYVFINTETSDLMEIQTEKIADQVKFLKEGLEVTIDMYEGEILGLNLPKKVE
jgi:elongation factor P